VNNVATRVQWATITTQNGSTINNIIIIPLPPQLDLTGGIWHLGAGGTITFRSLWRLNRVYARSRK
jgi:hypothetical protein